MTLPLLLTLPWFALLAFVLLRVRLPRELGVEPPHATPPVSVVIPARNEAANIATCLRSVCASRYPDFEVIVLDDGSEDGTGDIARTVERGRARDVKVLGGRPLPPGWLGKPWACAQGAGATRGELILFTDADTVHGPDLLERAVAALEEDRADVVTLIGRQLMGSFWERLVQPQIFLTLMVRYFDIDRALEQGRWRDVIANGQFLLFRRESYEGLGGHEAVRGEVIEDLALARLLVRKGFRLSMRGAEDSLATRMYRSLRQLVEGWSKNLLTGARRTTAWWLRPFIVPGSLGVSTALWIAPPAALTAAVVGFGGEGLLAWSAVATAVSVVFWVAVTRRMGAPGEYGLLYPLGALVGSYILCRSWLRGSRVAWKGREYVLDEPAPEAKEAST